MAILKNLLKVKSIITLAIIFTLCYETIIGVVPIELFTAIASAVVTYYFTKELNKKEENV